MADSNDTMYLSRGNDSFLEGNGIIILILFFLIFGFGGNGLGNGNNGTSKSLQTAELYSGLGSQDLKNDVRTGFTNVYDGQYSLSRDILQNRYDTQLAINGVNQSIMQNRFDNQVAIDGLNQNLMQNRYDNQLAISGINQNIASLGFQMQQCCCDMKTQMLQDKYDAAQNQLNLAEIASANAVQTQNILNSMGRYVMNPPVTSCGCGLS